MRTRSVGTMNMNTMDITDLIEEGLQRFSRLVLEDDLLRAEFEASVGEFFGGPLPAGDTRQTVLAARRHIEWFVLERHSAALRKTPVEGLLRRWHDSVPKPVSELAEGFFGSFTGVFKVTSLAEGGGGWLRDLAGYGEHPVRQFPSNDTVSEGDLVVGRLYPIEGEACCLSSAVRILRGLGLVAAIEADLERTRIAHGGSRVLHVSQRELEAMFWTPKLDGAQETASPAPESGPSDEEVLAATRRWLANAGLIQDEVDSVFRRLKEQPCDLSQLAHGGADELGAILDEMAFSSGIDLAEARRVLTQAWQVLSAPALPIKPEAPEPVREDAADPEPPDGARGAVAVFDNGRRAGQNLDELFGALERDLDLDEDSDDEEDTPAPDFPGVVGAMVEEFLWETRTVGGDEALAERYTVLRCLGRFGEGIGVFEELSAADLLRFTAFWLAERDELEDGAEARDLIDALEAFCLWAESAHEMTLKADFGETLAKLRLSLPRITDANKKLGEQALAEDDDTGELYEIVAAQGASGWKLLDRRGREHTASAPVDLSPLLQSGDRLRARIELDGQAVVYKLYPPEAGGLLTS